MVRRATPQVVVHLITRLELGGAQLATLAQVRQQVQRASACYLLYGPGGQLDAAARALPGVTCLSVPALQGRLHPGRDLRASVQIYVHLAAILARHPSAQVLLHTHSSKAGVLGRTAAAVAGVHHVVHSIHGFGHQPSMPAALRWGLWLSEFLAAQVTDGFSADSAANLQQAHRQHLIRASMPARFVPCGVPLGSFTRPPAAALQQRLRRQLGIAPGAPVVLMVACLKPQKDPLALVQVALRVRQQLPDTIFLLAGDGPLRDALVRARRCAGLEGTLRLLGWRRDVPALLHLCSLLLHTSRWEGLPQVFPQAMAAGRPIVATAVDGAPEAISHGHSGLLCPPGDVEALGRATVRLLRAPALAQRMGAAGRARAQGFSQARMLTQLEQLYADVRRRA